jgi:protein-disulfide isomerase
LAKSNKKSFAIIAIIVGAVGIGLGAYTIVAVGINLDQQRTTTPSDAHSDQRLNSLILNGLPMLGSTDAPITIIEFGDYQCPNCQRFNTQIKPLIVENYISTGKARLIFKDFTIYGHDSVNGAVATYCAGEQGKYWEMHDHLYESQRAINSGWLSMNNIEKFASEIGLANQPFKECLEDDKYKQQVMENFEQGKSIGITGTPTFVIIDRDGETKVVTGAQPYSVFKQILDEMSVN